jgi:hypothetical protein
MRRLLLRHGVNAWLGRTKASLPSRINEFLAQAVSLVRARFGGDVTYAAVPFEGVDWTPFDIVSVDLHRSKVTVHV